MSFSYDELQRAAGARLTAAIECAGNGRRLFASQQGMEVRGTPWGLGAIGVARWRGVPLAEVLERAGLRDDAVDLMPVGLDDPYVADGIDHGRVRRALPVGKALDDVLLAYEMNGETLPQDHGFPLRLVVPGWVGIASVKWLGRSRSPTPRMWSPWNTKSVPAVVLRAGGQERVRAAVGRAAPTGRRRLLHGRSWSRPRTDRARGREHRRRRELASRAVAGPAERVGALELAVDPRAGGRSELLARATDAAGRRQPDRVPFNCDGYLFWAVARHPVTISA